MKYYFLKESIDTKVVGKYFQSEEMIYPGDIYNVDYKDILSTLNTTPIPILKDKAIRTSFLSFPYINGLFFLIFNKKILDALKIINIEKYKLWDLSIHHKKEILTNYKLFNILDASDKKLINFEESKFLKGFLGDWKEPEKRQVIKIKNYEEYLKYQKVFKNNNSEIRCERLFLDFRNNNFDLIRVENNPVINGYLASEKLINLFKENNFTGLDYLDCAEYDSRLIVKY